MNHDFTADPISSWPPRRDCLKRAAQINPRAGGAESAPVCICKATCARVAAAVCWDGVICGELLEDVQRLPVTHGGVSERGIVCVGERCLEDSPGPIGQEGDAVMMNPAALTERELAFFATCGENCSKQELKIPR